MSSEAHTRRSVLLIGETVVIWILLLGANLALQKKLPMLLLPVVLFQGLWLYRFYAVAHEASHRKLFDNKTLNDASGALFMMWVWAPITIFRQIHEFHHGSNRRANGTATLDIFVESRPIRQMLLKLSWYLLVFAGGFFFHTLASILLFLILPRRIGLKLSPAFSSWTLKKRLVSWGEFAGAVVIHGSVLSFFGLNGWMLLLGYPVLVFAWLWSLMLYIYHYRTTVGRKVQFNTRSLPDTPLFSWLLLNFNRHSVHHNKPDIPWYDLPKYENPQPEIIKSQNQNVESLAAAILQQFKGPIFVAKESEIGNR